MKHRHTLMLLGVSLPVCVMLRTIQLFFTIDSTTGFIKQQYSAISMLITVVVCSAIASVSLLSASANETTQKQKVFHPLVAGASMLLGIMFVFQTVVEILVLAKGGWSNVFLVLLSLLTALVFVAYGAKELFAYKIPSIILAVPVVYYIAKLISVFVGAAKLALVTENVFFIFTNCVLLWFIFEFASFENEIGDCTKRPKSLFASGIAAVMLCAATALPKIILAVFGKISISFEDISAALINIAVGIFVAVYVLCNFADKEKDERSVSKHSA